MKKIIIGTSLALAAMAWASPSYSADVTLCSGTIGRNYDGVMQGVAAALQQRGHNVTVLNLGGSEDILNALNAGQCQYGPAQKDVHYKMIRATATFAQTLSPAALLYNEVMLMACSKESGIDELSDITADTKIITDNIGSGSALTWETMKGIEKEFGREDAWSKAQQVYMPLKDASAAIALGEADCAFGVGAVNSAWAKELENSGAKIAYIYDKDLNDLNVGKAPLYTGKRIPYGEYKNKFDTYLIPAVLFRSTKTKIDPAVDDVVTRTAKSLGGRYNTVQ